ncbi:hypothetical protein HELRODRAFT_172827 [Helobdella robusta]|uniref:Uncharacterized protein n=1 Tax=Helobdella robusta TaxID=6412 RepID=T1F5Z5_HELRO|nr:hypothetical protein HELRODRAFT_172827 [Helobdella robusta]ESO04435.1 hypothetical protein HELRODRAFT_172827 [Helobdella robusta]
MARHAIVSEFNFYLCPWSRTRNTTCPFDHQAKKFCILGRNESKRIEKPMNVSNHSKKGLNHNGAYFQLAKWLHLKNKIFSLVAGSSNEEVACNNATKEPTSDQQRE